MNLSHKSSQAVDNPLGRYALLSDCHSAALVGSDGSVDWWCAPRFDSRSCFARLLDPAAGHWSIRPVDQFDVERAYVGDSMVLRTDFHTGQGSVRMFDALALAPDARGHQLGEIRHTFWCGYWKGCRVASRCIRRSFRDWNTD